MENIILISVGIIIMAICVVVLIHDIKDDRENDRLEMKNYMKDFVNIPCTEKSEHCDYCGTDGCLYHPNNE